ncbi:MAG: hypothetical protein H6732_11760 [Alphaproteobacteria bacterium]|nr:hypothetical protein [Alphaproteobacteria bacterium]
MLILLSLTALAQEADVPPAVEAAPPLVEAHALRARTTPQPELGPGHLGVLEPGTTLVCPVDVVIRADGTPEEPTPTEACPGLVAALARDTVTRWTWWPPLAEGRNQAVRTTIRVQFDVPEAAAPRPTVAGLSPGQIDALQATHDLRPDGTTACRLRVSVGEDGRIRRRTTNLASCMVDALAGPPPPPSFATDRRTCEVRLISDAGKAQDVRVGGCATELKAWTEAAIARWLWLSLDPGPVPVHGTVVFPRGE